MSGRVEKIEIEDRNGTPTVVGVRVDGEVIPRDTVVIAMGPCSARMLEELVPGRQNPNPLILYQLSSTVSNTVPIVYDLANTSSWSMVTRLPIVLSHQYHTDTPILTPTLACGMKIKMKTNSAAEGLSLPPMFGQVKF